MFLFLLYILVIIIVGIIALGIIIMIIKCIIRRLNYTFSDKSEEIYSIVSSILSQILGQSDRIAHINNLEYSHRCGDIKKYRQEVENAKRQIKHFCKQFNLKYSFYKREKNDVWSKIIIPVVEVDYLVKKFNEIAIVWRKRNIDTDDYIKMKNHPVIKQIVTNMIQNIQERIDNGGNLHFRLVINNLYATIDGKQYHFKDFGYDILPTNYATAAEAVIFDKLYESLSANKHFRFIFWREKTDDYPLSFTILQYKDERFQPLNKW